MQIEIDLTEDSDNSYVNERLVLNDSRSSNNIFLKISDSGREVAVNKQELLRAIRILAEE